MFDRILFHYDREGKLLDKPREMTLGMVNATSFTMSTNNLRRMSGHNRGVIELPGVSIDRDYGDLKKDPYNEDGRPPCTLFFIANPHITHLGNVVEIIGWEAPNLTWAGIPRRPYSMCESNAIDGQEYLPDEVQRSMWGLHFEEMHRQKVWLISRDYSKIARTAKEFVEDPTWDKRQVLVEALKSAFPTIVLPVA